MKQNPKVKGAAPYVAAQAMITRDDTVHGVIVRGVLPALKARIRPAPIWLAKASAMRLRAELAVHTNNRL